MGRLHDVVSVYVMKGEIVSGVASYRTLGHVPPQLPTISFLVHSRVNPTATYPSIV